MVILRTNLAGFFILNSMEILYQNKQWRVKNDFTIESLNGMYDIPIELLYTVDWFSHMEQKEWVKIDLFQMAYEFVINNYNNG